MIKPICCNLEAVWIDNVPGKEYFFCQECRKEVLTPLVVEEVKYKNEASESINQSLEAYRLTPNATLKEAAQYFDYLYNTFYKKESK